MKGNISSRIVFFSVLLLAMICKLFVVDILVVQGHSMLPSIPEQTIVFEYKLAWGIPLPFSNKYILRWGMPEKDDIIIYAWEGRRVIKRCVGTGGSALVFYTEPGYSVEVEGRRIPLTIEQYQKMKHAVNIPENMVFAAGDNPWESRDSRDYGFISIDSIRGRARWK